MSVDREQQQRIGGFVLGEEIGRGAFSRVHLGTHVATGRRVAVKILERRAAGIDETAGGHYRVRREISALRRCDHHHVLRLFDVVETPDEYFLVTEYAGGGSLFDVMDGGRTPPMEEARRIFRQVLSGVAHCHERGVAHRDLKPENILLDDRCSSYKLGDFGFCGVVPSGEGRGRDCGGDCDGDGYGDGGGDGRRMRTPCGTPHYAAPEVIAATPYDGRAADVWSCGIVLYALLTGTLPFRDASSTPNLLKKIAKGKFIMPFELPRDVKELIRGMLEVDPAERMTMSQIQDNPWFQTNLLAYLCPSSSITAPEHCSDPDIVDQVLRTSFADVEVTREMVESAAGCRDDDGNQIAAEELRDVRCAYEILLNEKRSCDRAREISWTSKVSTYLHDALFNRRWQ